MDFAQWLQEQLDTRGWSQADLVHSAKLRGYQLSRGDVSRILNRERSGGVNITIAIAHGLHLSREEVFRKRGWLLTEPEQVVLSDMDPRLAGVLQKVSELSLPIREPLVSAIIRMLEAVDGAQEHTGDYVKEQAAEPSLLGPEWLAVEEAAAKTGYAIRTLQMHLKAKKIPGKKVGNKWFTTLAAVMEYKQQAKPGRPKVEPET